MAKNNNLILIIAVFLIVGILLLKQFDLGLFATSSVNRDCSWWLNNEQSKGYINTNENGTIIQTTSTNVNWFKSGTTPSCISSMKKGLSLESCTITYSSGWCTSLVTNVCTDTCESLSYTCGVHDICGVSVDCGPCGSGILTPCDFVTNVAIKTARSTSYDSPSAWISIDSNHDGVLEKYGRYSSGTTTTTWTYEKLVENYNSYGDDIYFDGTYVIVRSSSSYTKFKQNYGAAEYAASECPGTECTSLQTKCEGTTYYTCLNGNYVSQGQVDGLCGYITPPTCISHSSFSCYLGDVYWYNSCGTIEDLKQDCEDSSCVAGVCVAPVCGTADIDCDGVISRTELGTYVIKWINNEVSRDSLGTIIQKWITS